ncbi:MAG: DUF3504 domain-containing protein, partial [Proteobacteria bacterium]|nr:DUF3504 domain-containing protein [Pseudomonadota bacterium]
QPPQAKRKKLSLAKTKPTDERFSDTVSNEELEKRSCGFVPANTTKNTKWAIGVFKSWLEPRNCRTGETTDLNFLNKCFSGGEASKQELCRVLSLFVVETKKQDGKPYPAKTVYHLLAGILRYMHEADPKAPNFLDQKDGDFKKLHGTMDTHFRALRQQGVGAQVNHAKLLTQEENLMWQLGVMGTDTPRALLQSVFFYNGKKFLLRGGEEHKG